MTTLDKFSPVRSNSPGPIKPVDAGVPGDAARQRQTLAADGKQQPQDKRQSPPAEDRGEELKQAVNNIADYVQNIRRELNFSVDEELGGTIVTVIDEQSGDVIRQIPSEDMIELARTIARMKERSSKGLLFDGDA